MWLLSGNHTAKINQPTYPWAQHIVAIGLLNIIQGRWSCLPLASRFYWLKKDIDAHQVNAKKSGKTVAFQSKMLQAVEMLNAPARFMGLVSGKLQETNRTA